MILKSKNRNTNRIFIIKILKSNHESKSVVLESTESEAHKLQFIYTNHIANHTLLALFLFIFSQPSNKIFMWLGKTLAWKVLVLYELWPTESQTDYFSYGFSSFQVPNHRSDFINDIAETKSESNQKFNIYKTESKSEPNLSFLEISESESKTNWHFLNMPNPNRIRFNSCKNPDESESDFAFCKF